MEKLKLDTGRRRYRIGGGYLEFNPTDPNFYSRFTQAVEDLSGLEESLQDKSGEELLAALGEADKAAKAALGRAFGPGNDLDAVLQGVSLLAVTADGKRVLEKLLDALTPILRQGVRDLAKAQAEAL